MNLSNVLNELRKQRQRDRLTPQEQQVCAYVCGGTKTRQISKVMGLAVKTVEYHRTNIKKRLGFNDVASLVKWALRNGLTTL